MRIISSLLTNRYHRCGSLVARMAVCTATIIWSTIILVREDALAGTAYGPTLTAIIPENWIAGLYLAMSVGMLYRLVFEVRPNPWGIIAYTLMAGLWVFVDALLWLTHPLQLTALSWVTVGCVLAAFALVANPKRPPDDSA